MEKKEKEEEKRETKDSRKKPPLYEYARYMGVGIQMAAAVVLGFFLGQWIDKKVTMEFPLFTLIGSLFGVGAGLFYVIREFGSKK